MSLFLHVLSILGIVLFFILWIFLHVGSVGAICSGVYQRLRGYNIDTSHSWIEMLIPAVILNVFVTIIGFGMFHICMQYNQPIYVNHGILTSVGIFFFGALSLIICICSAIVEIMTYDYCKKMKRL